MSTWNDLVPSESKYLKKEDVGESGINLVITKFTRETIGQGNDQEEKAIIHFQGNAKPMVLNKTNAERLKLIFKTDNPDDVIGKPVNCFNDPFIEFGGKITGGIRIRPATGGGEVQSAPQAQPQAPQGNQQPTPPVEAYDDPLPF